MATPYRTRRATMAPDETRTPGARAYAVWFRQTYPTAPQSAASAWQLLATHPEGQRTRALWEHIAQAVLRHAEDQP